jgi:hypothetical protein
VKFSPNNDGMIWWQVEFLIQLCLWESNTETGKNENRETDSEEQGSKTYSCLYLNFSFFRFYEVLRWGRDVKQQICNLKFCYCSVENSILVVMSIATKRVRSNWVLRIDDIGGYFSGNNSNYLRYLQS